MTKKIHSLFPIQQDPACLLKWSWSNIYFNDGTTASCHRTQRDKIDPDNFGNFHNIPEKIKARQKMLQGQWPGHGCQYCKNVEDAGGESDRMTHLRAMTDRSLSPPELQIDPTSTAVTPTQIEVYFTNTCNMKCIYCGPWYSSSWEEENKKYSGVDAVAWHTPENVPNPLLNRPYLSNANYDKMVENFWQYLKKNNRYRSLRRLSIAGGEPFLLKELDQILDFWQDHPNPDLTINLISNLNVPHKRFVSYIDRFRKLITTGKIMTLQIVASVDCWGRAQEYVRYGLDLDLWKQNFQSIICDPVITCNINSALSALTIKEFPELLDKINHWNLVRAGLTIDEHNKFINHSFNYSTGVDNPMYFDGKVFEKDFEKILELMPTDSQIQRNQKKAMEGIFSRLQTCANDPVRITLFKSYLDKLDRRRGTNWRQIFSWLDQDFSVL